MTPSNYLTVVVEQCRPRTPWPPRMGFLWDPYKGEEEIANDIVISDDACGVNRQLGRGGSVLPQVALPVAQGVSKLLHLGAAIGSIRLRRWFKVHGCHHAPADHCYRGSSLTRQACLLYTSPSPRDRG